MRCEIESLPEFDREYKKLFKKYASLKQDLENFSKFVVAVDFDNNKRFDILYRNTQSQLLIIKTRLMVRSLKGSSKVRLIFAFSKTESKITLIELYLHGQQERENRSRIEDYIRSK